MCGVKICAHCCRDVSARLDCDVVMRAYWKDGLYLADFGLLVPEARNVFGLFSLVLFKVIPKHLSV